MFAVSFVNNFKATTKGDLHCLWQEKLRIKAASSIRLSLFIK
jgi:hypothetical protein